jgi:hypothetical protein
LKTRLSAAQVGEIRNLLNRWDPAGVRQPGEDGPAGHYDSCLPWIVSLVQGGGSVVDLTDHLSDLRTDTMGLPADRARDREIAQAIVALTEESWTPR